MKKIMLCPCCHTEQPAMGFQPAVKDGDSTEVCEACQNSEFLICDGCKVWVHEKELVHLASGFHCEECLINKEVAV